MKVLSNINHSCQKFRMHYVSNNKLLRLAAWCVVSPLFFHSVSDKIVAISFHSHAVLPYSHCQSVFYDFLKKKKKRSKEVSLFKMSVAAF